MTSLGPNVTRQGVRNLDDIGPKPLRGHVGKPREQHDEKRCAHFWEWVEAGGWTTPTFDAQRCALCGKWR